MTKCQSFGIYRVTGYDVRGCELTQEQITAIFQKKLDVGTIPGAILKRKPVETRDYDAIYKRVKDASNKADNALNTQVSSVKVRIDADGRNGFVKKYGNTLIFSSIEAALWAANELQNEKIGVHVELGI